MDACLGCGSSLHDSVSAELKGEVFKSCPSCSVEKGYHVFYRWDDFGMRNMGDGRHLVQPWCPDCRFRRPKELEVSFTCE